MWRFGRMSGFSRSDGFSLVHSIISWWATIIVSNTIVVIMQYFSILRLTNRFLVMSKTSAGKLSHRIEKNSYTFSTITSYTIYYYENATDNDKQNIAIIANHYPRIINNYTQLGYRIHFNKHRNKIKYIIMLYVFEWFLLFLLLFIAISPFFEVTSLFTIIVN